MWLNLSRASLTFSPANQGADSIDSDADPVSGRSSVITLAASTNIDTVDAGLFQLATIGDRVWNDVDGNGIQDTGETGLGDVDVRLLGQVDNFQDLSNGGGFSTPTDQNFQPLNIPDGGPNGIGDAYLRFNSNVATRELSRLVVRNQTQWQTDLSGMDAIEADVKNLGNTDLLMRIAINGPGGWFASTNVASQPIAAGTDSTS